jgi:hypothetical protein
MRLSREFRIAVKLADRPAWQIAREAGVNAGLLSKFMSGAVSPRRNDPRVLTVGKALGLSPEACFAAPDDCKAGGANEGGRGSLGRSPGVGLVEEQDDKAYRAGPDGAGGE